MSRIAVLLTVHNRKDKTLTCLRELMRQKLSDEDVFDVFLTDDGCTDGTPEAVTQEFPDVNIIRGDGNLFWNRGMYRAWEAASGTKDYDFYLWLNDDTILLPGAIGALLSESQERPHAVIVGPTHATHDERELTYSGFYQNRKIYPNGYLQACQTFNGNVVLIPRDIFNSIGNLDHNYVHAIGDVDYGWMVTRSGRKNYVSREFRGICDDNPRPPLWTRPDVPFKKRWQNFHSPLAYGTPGPMFHFNRKNFSLIRAIAVWTSNHIRVFFPWIWTK